MKTLFRILIIGSFFAIIFYYTNTSSTDNVLQGPDPAIKPIEEPDLSNMDNSTFERPTEGISLLIGEPTPTLEKLYGKPSIVFETVFTYDMWIYNNVENYMAVGVKDGVVTQVYTNSDTFNIAPYAIDTSADEIYASTILDAEITVENGENLYILSMNEKDRFQRILVKLDSIYAQLYIDEQAGKLAGIRFLDGETLVENKTYEMQFIGELMEIPAVSSQTMLESYTQNAEQLFTLINSFRHKYTLSSFAYNIKLNQLASSLSEQRYNNEIESLEISKRELSTLLENEVISYEKAEEIVAIGYRDPIETIHGILNSEIHREILLREEATTIGIGNYDEIYTQIIIEDEQ